MPSDAWTDWVWLRHAPVVGQESRYYGQLDVASEPVAPARAAAIARELPPVAVWLCSPLSRARATALALKEDVSPIPVPGFTEQDYGIWQGRTYNEVYAANRTLDWDEPSIIKPPQGESFMDVGARVAEAIERLSHHYAGHAIICIAHASTIRVAIAYAMGIEAEMALRMDIAPLSITRLSARMKDGALQWNVGAINFQAGR
jgi:broad specificity phosphatase PhoE